MNYEVSTERGVPISSHCFRTYICVEIDSMPSVTTLYIGIILIMFVCMCIDMDNMLFRIECIDMNSITL